MEKNNSLTPDKELKQKCLASYYKYPEFNDWQKGKEYFVRIKTPWGEYLVEGKNHEEAKTKASQLALAGYKPPVGNKVLNQAKVA